MNPSNILVISTSLHPSSRSRLLAKNAVSKLEEILNSGNENTPENSVSFVDMEDFPLPLCDGDASYQDENVQKLGELVEQATAILIAGPVYNYDFGAVAKNMIELVGRKMTDKPVGLICAAGGQGSYMALMPFAASIMLDFRCLVIPRFVYATGTHFQGNEISDPEILERIEELCQKTVHLSSCLQT